MEVGTTALGPLRLEPSPLQLDRSVSSYVKAALERLLPGAEGAPRIGVTIEQLELGHRGRMLGESRIVFRARLAVSVQRDDGSWVPAGRIDCLESRSARIRVTHAQMELMGVGLRAIAQALDRGALPLTSLARGEAASPAVVAVGLRGRRRAREEESERRPPDDHRRQIGLVGGGHFWMGGEVPGRHEGGGCFGLQLTEWRSPRDGVRISSGTFGAAGEPDVLDPSWRITRRDLSSSTTGFEIAWLHALAGRRGESRAFTYAGAGLASLYGEQEMEIEAYRGSDYVAGHARAGRTAAGLRLLLGGQCALAGPLQGSVEVSWLQAIGPSVRDVTLSDPAEVATWTQMKSIAGFPRYESSGLQLTVGFSLMER